MNHIKKMMSHLLVLGLLGGSAFTGAFSYTNSNAKITNRNQLSVREAAHTYTEADFADETDVGALRLPGEEDSDEKLLKVTINASNVTETSQSIDITFRSKTSLGFKDARQQNFLIAVNDPKFQGPQKPAPDGYDRLETVKTTDSEGHEIEMDLPVFDGSVCYLMNTGRSTVYLPSKLIWDQNFIVEVKTITSNCVTAEGEEYQGFNTWDGLSNIYIPKEITNAEAGAFTAVPDNVHIYYEGNMRPEGFDEDWIDNKSVVTFDENSYPIPESEDDMDWRTQNTSGYVNDLAESPSFVLGASNTVDEDHTGAAFDRPLVLQYRVKKNGVIEDQPRFKVLDLTNTLDHYYDACGDIRSSNYGRTIGFRLERDEQIIDSSIIFHNIMKVLDNSTEPDTSKTYYAVPELAYGGHDNKKQDIKDLVTFKKSNNAIFAGYSLFSLTMDKNLSVTSEAYPEPHSAYLDIATSYYLQNEAKIKSGQTKIRYSLYNLYNTSIHLVYKGKGGAIKDAYIEINTDITYQVLEKAKGNKVGVLFNDAAVRKVAETKDFKPENVISFELMDVTVRMDLVTTNEAGSLSNIGKTSVQFRFAYLTVFENGKANPFNWNLFLVIFFIVYAIIFAAGAYVLYRITKEKFKNDEFRRVNGKKFLKTAILDGAGLGVILAGLLFIIMRAVGFRNTIAVFNPTDPLLIAFAIAGAIILGYFIVSLVKRIKVDQERRKAIRLKLDEDVEEDGTN